MTPDLLQDFGAAIEQIKADPEVRCVIITGKGSSFCAGADFRNRASTADTERFMSPWEKSLYNTYGHFAKVLDIEVPTIAAMNGHAIGGGLGLALVCDMRVANSQSQYGANFTKLGLHPGMATTYILPRLVGMPKAMELIYTGRIMKGDEAAELGLANHSCNGADDVLAKAQVRGQSASLLTGLRCAHTDGAGCSRRSPARSRGMRRWRCAGPRSASPRMCPSIRGRRCCWRRTCSRAPARLRTRRRASERCWRSGTRRSKASDAAGFVHGNRTLAESEPLE